MKVSEKIIQIDKSMKNPLRGVSRLIKKEEFGTPHIKDVIRAMQSALKKESDGVAIAAPQIGLSLRIFVVSPEAYNEGTKWKPLIFINPKLTKLSRKKATMQEGCLSVRWIYGKTTRSIRATIEAYDVEGNKFTYGASGLMAHIFQHETDHLDGILFVDHGFDFEEFSEAEVKRAAEKNSAVKKK